MFHPADIDAAVVDGEVGGGNVDIEPVFNFKGGWVSSDGSEDGTG